MVLFVANQEPQLKLPPQRNNYAMDDNIWREKYFNEFGDLPPDETEEEQKWIQKYKKASQGIEWDPQCTDPCFTFSMANKSAVR